MALITKVGNKPPYEIKYYRLIFLALFIPKTMVKTIDSATIVRTKNWNKNFEVKTPVIC